MSAGDKAYAEHTKEAIAARKTQYTEENKEHIAEQRNEYNNGDTEMQYDYQLPFELANAPELKACCVCHTSYTLGPSRTNSTRESRSECIHCVIHVQADKSKAEYQHRHIIGKCGAVCSEYSDVQKPSTSSSWHLKWLAACGDVNANPTS